MAKANEPVQDAVKAYLELALGLTEASKKKAEKTVKKVAREVLGKSNATASQLQSMAEDVISTGLANREAVVKLVQAELERALSKVGLVKAEEVQALTSRIDELERQLAAASGDAKPVVSKAALAEAASVAAKKTVAKKTVAKKAVAKPVTAKSAVVDAPRTVKTTAAKTAPAKTAAKSAPVKSAAKAASKKATPAEVSAPIEPPAPVQAPIEQEISAVSSSVAPALFSSADADDVPAAVKRAPAKKVAKKTLAKKAARS
jgi:polyhydroxyalkanoate synthesis regulator phasin